MRVSCVRVCVRALLRLLVGGFVARAVGRVRTPAWRYDACKLNLLPQLNGFETEEEALRLEKGENGISGVCVV